MASSLEEENARLRGENRALAQELSQARDLIEIAPAFFGYLSTEGRLLELNQLALSVIEASRAQVIGRLFWEAPWWRSLPHSARRIEQAVRAGAQGVSTRLDLEYWSIRNGVGGQRWAITEVTPQLDTAGEVVRLAVSGVDITERIGVQEALRKSQAQLQEASAAQREELQRLFMTAPFFLCRLQGPDHVFRMVNDACRKLLGDRELIGRKVSEAMPEVAAQGFVKLLDQVYQTGEAHQGREQPIRLRRGPNGVEELLYINFNHEVARDAEGEVDGVIAYGFDITETVEVRKRTERLAEQAMVADRRKDEFLAMLGHELRNPLTPSVTAVKLMELKGQRLLRRERKVIERQVKHLSRLVDDLRDVSRIAQGRIRLNKARLDLADVLAHAIELSSPLFENKSQELLVQVPRGELFVDGDPFRLAQVFYNLLSNAGKYSAARGKISLHAFRDGNFLVVKVSDNGIGIAADLLAHVFDLFVQGTQPLNRAEGGLGSGLALVRSLLLLHGGKVSAASAGVNLGSELTVRLPALEPLSSEPDLPAANRDRTDLREGHKILLVDDNVDSIAMLADALTAMGHHVEIAHDGPEALLRLEAFQPAIGILDLGLPVMDGYELAMRMRANSHAPGRLIALTGYGQEEDRQRTTAAGFDAHLVKPIELQDLGDLLATYPIHPR